VTGNSGGKPGKSGKLILGVPRKQLPYVPDHPTEVYRNFSIFGL